MFWLLTGTGTTEPAVPIFGIINGFFGSYLELFLNRLETHTKNQTIWFNCNPPKVFSPESLFI